MWCWRAVLLLVIVQIVPHSGLTKPKPLILGVNKYSHDTSICILDSSTGAILYSQAKERITKRKHDGGGIGELLKHGLNSVGGTIDDINIVVSNNHHFRVIPYEKRIPLYTRLNYVPTDYNDVYNLLPNAKHCELSHHLAHAWSAYATSPFNNGLILVMDGMGESYKAMIEDILGIEENSGDYMHDLKLLKTLNNDELKERFVGIPRSLSPGSGYREAESAYTFNKNDNNNNIIPLFKRWSRERSPPELYNHGFENMESMGAIYSRISSYILGDWNACGKIMGLAPWSNKKKIDANDWVFDKLKNRINIGENFHHNNKFMSGNPYEIDSFTINWKELESLSIRDANADTDAKFSEYATIAASVQSNLESSAMNLVTSLRMKSSESNLILSGGVALNSVLNGKISRESGFNNVYISPCPGDEGIAIGCAYYGYQRYKGESSNEEVSLISPSSVPKQLFSPFHGKNYEKSDIIDAIDEHYNWINCRKIESTDSLVNSAVTNIMNNKVIAWYQGKSELGQRALGNRSILADPRNKNIRKYINEIVKEREWYRPLAPSVLNEFVPEWFEGSDSNYSPYMSITSQVKLDKQPLVPAICHIDGSARLQTVKQEDCPLYYRLIDEFRKYTKVPMLLNTSFNRKSMPIVETPSDAIKTLLQCKGSVHALYLEDYEITIKSFPLSLETSIPNDDENNIFVFANEIYLTEVVSSTSKTDPVRVRVQDGGDADDTWKELPSQLHLEILILLQSNGGLSDPDDSEDSIREVTTIEMFEAISQIYSAEDDQVDEDRMVTWGKFVSVLKWLYEENMIYFDDPSEMYSSVDEITRRIPPGTKILDIRD